MLTKSKTINSPYKSIYKLVYSCFFFNDRVARTLAIYSNTRTAIVFMLDAFCSFVLTAHSSLCNVLPITLCDWMYFEVYGLNMHTSWDMRDFAAGWLTLQRKTSTWLMNGKGVLKRSDWVAMRWMLRINWSSFRFIYTNWQMRNACSKWFACF